LYNQVLLHVLISLFAPPLRIRTPRVKRQQTLREPPSLMNRYRSIPGLGPVKSSASTTCQKCLKKGHYSYECKASLQDRPYASRPSRSQMFKNPKLAPPLASDKPNDLMSTEGIADKVLAGSVRTSDAQARRSRSPTGQATSPVRHRSRSPSVDSISTVSTNRSRSESPATKPGRSTNNHYHHKSQRNGRSPSPSRSPLTSRARKRRYDSMSSDSRDGSPRPAPGSHRKNRRHRTASPDDRGRPHSFRRGSRRSRSGSLSVSMDKSRITKQRRVIDDGHDEEATARYTNDENFDSRRSRGGNNRFYDNLSKETRGGQSEKRNRDRLEEKYGDGGARRSAERKERSLSPYSRRLALTQAMNLGA
jgi:Zinc knuckle